MKFNEYFYLSEIILGLREEYFRTRRELEELKSMMTVDNNYNASLGVYSTDATSRYLVIQLEEKANGLKKLINEVSKKVKNNTLKTEISCDSGYNRNYVLVNEPSKYRVDDLNDFYRKCDEVLHTPLNFSAIDTYAVMIDENMKLKVGHNGVYCVTDNYSEYAPNTGFDYYANNDQLVINNYYGNPAFGASVNKVMHTPIPKAIVGSRLSQIIEENPKSILPIKFEGLTNTKATQYFNLIEENNKVIALRVR